MTTVKLLLLIGIAALLVACGSKVQLNEPAVEDKSGLPIGQSNAATQTPPLLPSSESTLQARDVKPIEVVQADNQAASNVVYFDFDSFVIKAQFQKTLEEQAKKLIANRNGKLSVIGHTDDLGGREYNIALGQKRAEAVARALGILGVSEAQMESVSFGKEKPAVNGVDEPARAQNRRVEMVAR